MRIMDRRSRSIALSRNSFVVPPGLRSKLEAARLDLLALFRSLDRLHLFQDLPSVLREAFELDADLAEGLWALDQPPERLNFRAMIRDTLASLAAIPAARARLLDPLGDESRARLAANVVVVRGTLDPKEAYNDIPDR